MPQLSHREFEYLAICLEGFFFGELFVLQLSTPVSEEFLIPGIYSGIFAVHSYYVSDKGSSNKKRSIIFYALCILYILSLAVIALDIALFLAGPLVSIGIFF
jgi:FtsH-binding integral membrane protein